MRHKKVISRKLILLLIAISILFRDAEFAEVLKIPQLVEHYQAHKSNDNLSFFAFVQMHYTQPVVVDHDFEDDNKLPFREHEHCAAQSSIMIINANESIRFIHQEARLPESNSFNQMVGTQLSYSIWQPPKLC